MNTAIQNCWKIKRAFEVYLPNTKKARCFSGAEPNAVAPFLASRHELFSNYVHILVKFRFLEYVVNYRGCKNLVKTQ